MGDRPTGQAAQPGAVNLGSPLPYHKYVSKRADIGLIPANGAIGEIDEIKGEANDPRRTRTCNPQIKSRDLGAAAYM
jgi:hypothetical protein